MTIRVRNAFKNALLVLLPLQLAVAGCRKSETAGNPKPSGEAAIAIKVKVTEVGQRLFTDEIEALGTVRAKEAVELSTTVTERVVEVAFEDGDRVKQGALLVRLQDAEEVAAMAAAQSEMAEQEREIQRLEGLVREGAVSEVRLQEYRTRREIAEQRVAEARAKISDRRLEAPFDGVLGFRRISLGALVSPGDVITTLDVLDPVTLDFTVPETFLEGLQPGQRIIARTEAYPEQEFAGPVTQIDTRVNTVTRSITVRAEIPNPELRLRPGLLMVTTLKKNPKESPSVPERCVVSVQTDHYVYVLDAANGNKALRRQIVLGRRLPGYVEILRGAQPGETVVTDGLIGLTDGAAVEIVGRFTAPAEPYQPASLSH